jgi:glutathione synthase
VFLVAHDRKNVNQMIQAVSRDGYVVCQEYLPGAARGDLRVFLMNGQPLEVEGRCAAFRRVSTNGDFRSNISAGGRLEAAEIPTSVRELVELVRPKLIRDGMFLVGLDVADDKLMEVNVFSPGGLYVAEREYGVPFCRAVIEAVERKVGLRSHYAKTIENVEFAIL